VVRTTEADQFYKTEVGVTLTPPTGTERAEGWAGLQGVRELKIKYEELDRPACDIAISGLGWISVEPLGVPSNSADSNVKEECDTDYIKQDGTIIKSSCTSSCLRWTNYS